MKAFPLQDPKVLVALAFLLVVAIGWVRDRDTTSNAEVRPGDCFIVPDEEFDRTETTPCDAAHDGQFVSLYSIDSADGEYPADDDEGYWDRVFQRCFDDVGDAVVRQTDLPDDFDWNVFVPTEDGWRDGDRTMMCYVYAEGGLEGSFIATIAERAAASG